MKCWMCSRDTEIVFGYRYKGVSRDLCVKCASLLIRVEENVASRAIAQSIASPRILTIKEAEKDTIEAAMLQGLTKTDSAAALGITRATLYSKIKEYGIEPNGTSIKIDDGQAGSEICDVHQRRKAC